MIPLSLYIHIPWCVKKCPYCDFNSYAITTGLPEEQYIQCLLADLRHDLPHIQGRAINSIFFGGGTPSLFSPTSIGSILEEISKLVTFAPDLEITLETNPGTIEHHSLTDYQYVGINRFSIGAQTFDDNLLQTLGRIHRSADTINVVTQLQDLHLKSFNIDIMHGLPQQNVAQALLDLKTAIELGAPHISWYQLTIEPNTIFAKTPPQLPTDDTMWEIYTQGLAMLDAAGLQQYEVSAFSKPEHQCAHNLNYWNFGDYLGIGAGAHAKITDISANRIQRFWKTRSPKDYMQRNLDFIAGRKVIAPLELPGEFAINQLRLTQGFTLTHFSNRTGLPAQSIADIIKRAVEKGLLIQEGELIQTTELGRRFLNDLLQMFLMEEISND